MIQKKIFTLVNLIVTYFPVMSELRQKIWEVLNNIGISFDPQKLKKMYELNHHHHVVRLAQISLTLSLHVSLSFITSGRSSGLHPVSSHSCCMYVWAGRSAFDWPYAGVHRSTSLMKDNHELNKELKKLTMVDYAIFLL